MNVGSNPMIFYKCTVVLCGFRYTFGCLSMYNVTCTNTESVFLRLVDEIFAEMFGQCAIYNRL